MSISLNQLCKNVENKYALKLIAGKFGLENLVRWVHMIEDTEVPDFLHGNELIFTTGIANYKENWLLHFVQNLKSNNSAGVVINLGPYISSIPPQVIVYCEQNDFPLFTIPWDTRIIDITYEFCRVIINDEKVEQSLTEAFKNLIKEPSNKEGYSSTLERLGFNTNVKYCVISMRITSNNQNITSKFLSDNEYNFIRISKINNHSRGFFFWDKCLILIYQNLTANGINNFTASLEKISSASQNVKIHIGISDSIDGYDKLCDIYKQSKSALVISEIKNKLIVRYKEIGVYKLLYNLENKELLKEYYENILGDLISYDNEHKTDFYKTLNQYCKYNGSIQKMAEITGVHRNTINYKMKKIKEIMKSDLDYRTNMDIMLAFIIFDIINKN